MTKYHWFADYCFLFSNPLFSNPSLLQCLVSQDNTLWCLKKSLFNHRTLELLLISVHQCDSAVMTRLLPLLSRFLRILAMDVGGTGGGTGGTAKPRQVFLDGKNRFKGLYLPLSNMLMPVVAVLAVLAVLAVFFFQVVLTRNNLPPWHKSPVNGTLENSCPCCDQPPVESPSFPSTANAWLNSWSMCTVLRPRPEK